MPPRPKSKSVCAVQVVATSKRVPQVGTDTHRAVSVQTVIIRKRVTSRRGLPIGLDMSWWWSGRRMLNLDAEDIRHRRPPRTYSQPSACYNLLQSLAILSLCESLRHIPGRKTGRSFAMFPKTNVISRKRTLKFVRSAAVDEKL